MGTSVRSQEIEDLILTGIASGLTLTAVCQQPGMPSRITVLRWRDTDPDFKARYEEALSYGYEANADAILDIVDAKPEYIQTKDGMRVDTGFVAWQRLRTDNRIKYLERLDPARYAPGSKVALGNDGNQPLRIEGVDRQEITLRIAKAMREAKALGYDARDD